MTQILSHTPLGAVPAPRVQASPEEQEAVRAIRRQVAETLTAQTRLADDAGAPLSPAEHIDLVRQLISQALDEHARARLTAGQVAFTPSAESRVRRALTDALLGLGGLQALLDDPEVEDITAVGCDQVVVRYAGGRREKVPPIADTDSDLIELIRTLAARSGTEERRFDRASPILDLQLPDGSRLHAKQAVVKRPTLAIRRHRHLTVTLAELRELGTFDTRVESVLRYAVRAKLNIVGAGGTSTGKTTLLRALAREIPYEERILTLEDTFELALDKDPNAHIQVESAQARQANLEGEGAISLAALFAAGLRSAPDRVIVGEVRGGEVVIMLLALSQGNDGGMSTLHADSSANVFERIKTYATLAQPPLPGHAAAALTSHAIHLVVHLAYELGTGARYITSIREVTGYEGDQVLSNEIFAPGPDGRARLAAPMSARLAGRLRSAGMDMTVLHDARGPQERTML